MPKRFSATEIWDEDWFLDMPDCYKLFWFYVLAKCDHAGVFKVNVNKFNRTLTDKKKVLPMTAINHFNKGKERIRILSENKWFVEDFFVFQYGEVLNRNSKVHESIENIYNQLDIKLTSIRGLKDLKDRVKDKDKDKEKKGGMGENKNGKHIRAVEIRGKLAYFEDGSSQELGLSQNSLQEIGQLKPDDIVKGLVS